MKHKIERIKEVVDIVAKSGIDMYNILRLKDIIRNFNRLYRFESKYKPWHINGRYISEEQINSHPDARKRFYEIKNDELRFN